MAQTGTLLDPETFSCFLCLDLLKDPVATSCGHSYCSQCLQRHWDAEEERGAYSCPQCERIFEQRPILEKNAVLAALLQALGKTGPQQAAPADECYAGAEDVACDVCSGRKLKALKSCLACRASYCDSHLQPHREVAPLQKHKLVEPSQGLQVNICPHHDEVMKIFCRTDQQSICYLCSMDEHRGHDTVSAAAERKEREKQLEETRQKIQHSIQHREEDLMVLQKEVASIDGSADKAVKDIEDNFTMVIGLLEKMRSEVQQQVRCTQEDKESQAKELQMKLEQEIAGLKRRDAELQKISRTLDHSQFLESFSSLPALSPSPDSYDLKARSLRYFDVVSAAVSKFRDDMQEVLTETLTAISRTVRNADVLLNEPEPRSRKDFLRYSRQMTLDPNTAHKRLMLIEKNRKVTAMEEDQRRCDHPDRFTVCHQVLSAESLTDRCYWELDWGGGEWGGVEVAVAYRNISRSGESDESGFGSNDTSWSLFCYPDGYQFSHNNISTDISDPKCSRVGVYLDHRAGLLSFYSISRTMKLLHRVQTTFTQPLHAGFGLGFECSAKLMNL